MSGDHEWVLVLNPGTTSTKFGVFTRAGVEMARNIHHGDEEIERFRGRPMLDRLDYRAGRIESALSEAGFTPKGKGTEPWAAVAGRGGLLPPMDCGTYLVDDTMVEELRQARRGAKTGRERLSTERQTAKMAAEASWRERNLTLHQNQTSWAWLVAGPLVRG